MTKRIRPLNSPGLCHLTVKTSLVPLVCDRNCKRFQDYAGRDLYLFQSRNNFAQDGALLSGLGLKVPDLFRVTAPNYRHVGMSGVQLGASPLLAIEHFKGRFKMIKKKHRVTLALPKRVFLHLDILLNIGRSGGI